MSFKVNNIFPYFNPNTPLFNINSINSIPILPPTSLQDGYIIAYDSVTKAFVFKNSMIERGATGPTGAQGAPGLTGIIGSKGPIGSTGLIGSTGPMGIRGTTGPRGHQGVVGITGSQGYIGITGPTGPQGYQGSIGMIGSQGSYGPQGNIGQQGIKGYGTIGPTGPTGSAGPPGNDDVYFYCCPQWFDTDCQMIAFFNNTQSYLLNVLQYNQKSYIDGQFQQQIEFENFVNPDLNVGPFNMLYLGYNNILVFPQTPRIENDSNNNAFVYNTINKRINYTPIPTINNGIVGGCVLKDNSVIFIERSSEEDYDTANVYRFYPDTGITVKIINGETYFATSNNDYRSPITLPNGNVILTPGNSQILIEFNPNIANQSYSDNFVFKQTGLPSVYNFGIVTSSGNVIFFPANPYTQCLLYNPVSQFVQECAYNLPNGIQTGCILPSGGMLVANSTSMYLISEPDNPFSTITPFASLSGSTNPILLPNSYLLFTNTTSINLVNSTDFTTSFTFNLPVPMNQNMKGLVANRKFYYITTDNNLNSIDFFFDEGFNDSWNTSLFLNNYNTPY